MIEFYKKYSELTKKETEQIVNLIIKGGEVNPVTLTSRLSKTHLIGVVKIGDLVIATASIKNPLESYSTKVFLNANYESYPSEYELGYIMVDENFRNQKLASKLCNRLCQNYPNTRIFATTKVENMGMLSILKKNSFKEVGMTYLNEEKNSYLKLLIKTQ